MFLLVETPPTLSEYEHRYKSFFTALSYVLELRLCRTLGPNADGLWQYACKDETLNLTMRNTAREDELYGTVLRREGRIDTWQAEVWATTLEANLRDGVRKPGSMITLFGAFTVAVGRIRKFAVSVQPGVPIIGNVSAPAVGAIVSTFKVVEAIVTLSPEEYQTVLALVTTGHLLHVSCTFVKPVEGSAKILAITISTAA